MRTSFVEGAQKRQKEDTSKNIIKIIEPGIQDADEEKVIDMPFNPENVEKALDKMEKRKRIGLSPNKFMTNHWRTL